MLGKAIIGLLTVCLLIAGATAGCTAPTSAPDRSALSASRRPPPSLGDRLPKVPPRGALFGAYVDPPLYTESARISAVLRFERLIGRRLDIFHDYHTWTDPFPSEADMYFAKRGSTVLLSWAGADTRLIASGHYDALIARRARDVKRFGYPVLIEWRWEMNRPNLASEIHTPVDYVAAWHHIRAIFDRVGVTNASWVWCPLVEGDPSETGQPFYPGDASVDWLCADVYALAPSISLGDLLTPYLDWAAGHRKPILLGEFGTQRGAPDARARWLSSAEAFVSAHPQIKGVVYFESARGAAGAFDVESEPSALRAMRVWAADPYFNPSQLSAPG